MKMLKQLIKKGSFSALLLMTGLLLTSCEPDKDVEQVTFGVSQTDFALLSEGGSQEIKITAPGEWTVESNVEWCLVSPGNGSGNTTCELRVDTSYLYQQREAILTFHSGSLSKQVKVSQLGYEKVIRPELSEVKLPDYGEYGKAFVDVKVVSNVEFAVELPEGISWLSVKSDDSHVSSVPRPRTVRLEYKINDSFVNRITEIKFVPVKDKDQQAQPGILKVTQQAAPKITPSRRGDSLALITIARLINSYNAITPSQPMIYWPGIKLKEFPVENGNPNQTELRVTEVDFLLFRTKETIPYQIKFLTKLEKFSMVGNENGYLRRIDLGKDITELKNLKHLRLTGYGLRSIPEEMSQMKTLQTIVLDGNSLSQIPVHIFKQLPNLTSLSLVGNRQDGLADLSQVPMDKEIGFRGELPRALFELDKLEYLSLSYNYFEGSIPDMPVGSMPNLKQLSLNLNLLTGEIPQWILQHPTLGCWNPFVLLFNQEGVIKDSKGRRPGLTNVPNKVPSCPDDI